MELFNQADIVALLIILYFTCSGWVLGIMPFLLGFASFFVSSHVAFSYFQGTQNILESLKIFLALSAATLILAWIGLALWNKIVVKSKLCHPLSRCLGATVGFCWAFSLSASIMLAFVLIPSDQPFFQKTKKLSETSYLYTFVESRFLSNYPLYQTLKKLYEQPPSNLESQAATINIEEIISPENIEAIQQNKNIQAIIADEQIKDMIENKDFGGLLSNPKIKDLLQDKEFMDKLLKVYSGMATKR